MTVKAGDIITLQLYLPNSAVKQIKVHEKQKGGIELVTPLPVK
jgi:hypothetical protein